MHFVTKIMNRFGSHSHQQTYKRIFLYFQHQNLHLQSLWLNHWFICCLSLSLNLDLMLSSHYNRMTDLKPDNFLPMANRKKIFFSFNSAHWDESKEKKIFHFWANIILVIIFLFLTYHISNKQIVKFHEDNK